ncbi:MAG: hypothetical protein OEZ01_07025 [Candidatus Heimdallarchaeota archaeon]|nr:hypothetical protein [Candidatus Heimdallarchaeota archaeon]
MDNVFLGLFLGIIGSLVASLLYNLASKFLKFLRRQSFPSIFLSSYNSSLTAFLNKMPFIYKDIESDVLNDFVEIDIKSIESSSYKPIVTHALGEKNQNARIKQSKRIIFLGDAGIGKTTFQRHCILQIVNNTDLDFLLQGESPIPIYIPLKVVSNIRPSPIFQYIYEKNSFFSGSTGLKRLIRYAKKGRIFLFLDGYDEISFGDPSSQNNYIRDEIGILMSPELLSQHTDFLLDPMFFQVYSLLDLNRVWLSSRKEFFVSFPIFFQSEKYKSGLSNLSLMQIHGIDRNRAILAKNIFDKYRIASEQICDLLNEEFFIRIIDEESDIQTKELSYNPLFLTVMCYIYASKVAETKDYKIAWFRSAHELVLECINLLLIDIDEYKVRDVPNVFRDVVLSRRNLHIEEKKEFLRYLSGKLYFDEKNVFDYEYIKSNALVFFNEKSTSADRKEIIAEISDLNRKNINIISQLIYSGLFVITDVSREHILYDFPHRRFREILACIYFSDPENYLWLLANAEKGHLSEIIDIFVVSKYFSCSNLHEGTLKLMLSRAMQEGADSSYYTASDYFSTLSSGKVESLSVITENFLYRILSLENPCFELSSRLLYEIIGNKSKTDLSNSALKSLKDAMENKKPEIASVSSSILLALNNAPHTKILESFIFMNIHYDIEDGNMLLGILQQIFLHSPKLAIQALLKRTSSSKNSFASYAGIALSRCSNSKPMTHVAKNLTIVFSHQEKVDFFSAVWVFSKAHFRLWAMESNFKINEEYFNISDALKADALNIKSKYFYCLASIHLDLLANDWEKLTAFNVTKTNIIQRFYEENETLSNTIEIEKINKYNAILGKNADDRKSILNDLFAAILYAPMSKKQMKVKLGKFRHNPLFKSNINFELTRSEINEAIANEELIDHFCTFFTSMIMEKTLYEKNVLCDIFNSFNKLPKKHSPLPLYFH